MTEVLIQCEGYTSDELMRALVPYVDGTALLEVRPRKVTMRSPALDPNVLAGIIQAGAGVLTALITGLVGWRRAREQASGPDGGTGAPARPIRIFGADGTVIEIPLNADEKTLALLVEQVRRIERPRIELL
ncbi:MAG TPA: hypothetical protein VFE05_23565 [Longimicrobiaceae bacterium]|jgi:hypothetical protein|nr:hypothetical protein [Longimicrobiaceae bacterium]